MLVFKGFTNRVNWTAGATRFIIHHLDQVLSRLLTGLFVYQRPEFVAVFKTTAMGRKTLILRQSGYTQSMHNRLEHLVAACGEIDFAIRCVENTHR